MAEGRLGRRRRQLHRARHAVQHRHTAAADARCRSAADRRSPSVPRHRRGRARTEVRRRHRHAPRLHSARHRRQSPRRALRRRGRRPLAEALRELGQSRRATAVAAGVLPPRREDGEAIHAVGVSSDRRPTPFRNWPRVWVFRRIASSATVSRSTRRFGRGRSTTRRSTTAARRGSSRTRVTGRSDSTRRRSGDIRCVRASHSPISGCASTRPAG